MAVRLSVPGIVRAATETRCDDADEACEIGCKGSGTDTRSFASGPRAESEPLATRASSQVIWRANDE